MPANRSLVVNLGNKARRTVTNMTSIKTRFQLYLFLTICLTSTAWGSNEEEVSGGTPIWMLWTQLDTDKDGVKNVDDAFPRDATEFLDTDKDGVGNNADVDDDDDGVADDYDDFPLVADEWVDSDNDGIGNNADTDDDGDGVADSDDVFPLNGDEWVDTDLDGIGDNQDNDDDNDGIPDDLDAQRLIGKDVCNEYVAAAPANTFRYCWEENVDNYEGDEYASTVNQPIEVVIEDETVEIPDNSHAELLYADYGLVLDAASGWTEEQAYAIHSTLSRIPLYNSEVLDGYVLSLVDEFLSDDIDFETGDDASKQVAIGRAAFENAVPRIAQVEGRRGLYFSNRLHRALVRLVTKNGADADHVDRILRERFGVTTFVPDIEALTGERADRFQPFQPEELVSIISIFEEMPQGYHKIPELDYLVRRLNGVCSPAYGCDVPAIAWTGSGYIEFLESGFNSLSLEYVHRLIIHEKAHFLWAKVFDDSLKNDWIELGGWYRCTEKTSGWCSTKQTQFVSAYAHLKNPDEDFAETAADFIINPDIVRSRAPAKYEFVRDRVMQGTIYLARIREDLTFTVYNLFPDYVYPGKIRRIKVEVAGEPEQDKDLRIEVEIHALDLALEGAELGFTRINSPKFIVDGNESNTFLDLYLYPEDAQNGLGTRLVGTDTLSKYVKAGLWRPEQISITDAVGNARFSGANDFGWRMMMDNPLEDLIPPKYVSNTVNLDLTQKEYDNQVLDVIVATWNAEEAHVRGPGGCYGALNDEYETTYSRQEYGPSNEEGCTVDFYMPNYMPGGIYSLSVIRNIDAAGNDKQLIFRSDYAPDELPWDAQDAGEPAAIIEFVSENPDLLPPEIDLNDLSVSAVPTNPQAPNGETVVEFTFKVRDDISGYALGYFNLRDPQGINHGYYHYQERRGDFYPLPGELDWQEYTATVVLPAGSAPGLWGVSEFTVQDRAGNFKPYNFVETVTFDVIE